MKRIFVFVIAAVLICFAAFAESDDMTYYSLEGIVTEISGDGGYVINSAEHGDVQVMVGSGTIVEAAREIAVGDYIFVDFDGKMTRSIPAQISAQAVRMHVVEGDIVEKYAEENAVLLSTGTHGEVYVTLTGEWDGAEMDFEHMTVYFNGAMTMSLPAQINAGMVVPGYSLQGVVSEIADGHMIIGEGMEAVQVNAGEGVLPEDMRKGDIVRVIYDGQMTRSLPAQINAISVVQISR